MLKNQFLVFVLLFILHLLVMLESSSTTANTNFTIPKNRTKRAVSTISVSELWKDAIIAYEINSDLEPQRCLIESAMMHIMLQSCVLFRPVHDHTHEQKLVIVKDNIRWCYAGLGAHSINTMSLSGDRCFNIGVILHELMHVLGFEHEHQRSDRDQYLQIHHDNLNNFYSSLQFNKNDRSDEIYLPQFDIDSITIYGNVSGSKDPTRLKTIESKFTGKQVVAPNDKSSLSPLDVKSINELYKCNLVDNKACEKVALLDGYITNCSAESRKYINLSLIKKLIDQCK